MDTTSFWEAPDDKDGWLMKKILPALEALTRKEAPTREDVLTKIAATNESWKQEIEHAEQNEKKWNAIHDLPRPFL